MVSCRSVAPAAECYALGQNLHTHGYWRQSCAISRIL
jgi:hypothetical protein